MDDESVNSPSQEAPIPEQQPPANTQQPVISDSAASTEQDGLNNAGIRFRWAAFFFDGLFISIPLVLAYFAYFFFSGKHLVSLYPEPSIPSFIPILYAVLDTVYYVYFDIKDGSTPGKKIYGLKVIESDSFNLLTLKSALIRELVAKTSYFIPLIGSVFQLINGAVIFLSKENKAIHDNLVKSRVVIVGKPWSIFKQLALFILISAIVAVPLILYLPNLARQATNLEDIDNCTRECVDISDSGNMNIDELQSLIKSCRQQCSEK